MSRGPSDWRSSIDVNLPLVVERFRRVEIMSRPALGIIKRWDSPETLFYLDPPYIGAGRTSSTVYDHEMNEDEHRQLVEAILQCSGKVILSGYANPLYEALLKDWRQVKFNVPNNAASGKKKARREEVLWLNFEET